MILPRKTSHYGNAFTLLEVMIAVMTFAIVLAAINTVFYGALRLRNKTTQTIEKSLPIQQTVALIRRDLAGIVPPGGTLAGALRSDAGTSATAPGGIGSMALEAGPEIFTNTGTVDEAAPWAEVQKVSYYLRPPTNDVSSAGQDLIRAVTRNLLPTLEDQPTEEWVMSGVERIQFFFYSGTEWRDSWDSTTEESALPKAIKVQIQLAEDENEPPSRARTEEKPPIEIVVPVIVQARTNQTQTAGSQP